MATDLLDRCGDTVPLEFQEQGYELADRGDVELFRAGSAGRFLALVYDPELPKEPAIVVVRWGLQRRAALTVSCSCGRIQPWRGCSHVWAMLVAMSRKGYGSEIPGAAPLQLLCSAVGKDEKAELLAKLASLSSDPRGQQLVKKPADAAGEEARPLEAGWRPFFTGLSPFGLPPLGGPGPVAPKERPAPPVRGPSEAGSAGRLADGPGGGAPPAPPARPKPNPRFTLFLQNKGSQSTSTAVAQRGPRPMLAPLDRLKPPPPPGPPPPPPPPDWRRQLEFVIPTRAQREPARPRLLFYFLGPYDSLLKTFRLEFWQQERLATGKWGTLKTAAVQANELADLGAAERQLVRRLLEAHREIWMEPPREPHRTRAVAVPSSFLPLLLPALAATGRFGRMVKSEAKKYDLYEWDDGGPWRLVIEGGTAAEGGLALRGRLRRGEEDLPLSHSHEILSGGLFRHGHRLAELEAGAAEEWLRALRSAPEIVVPEAEVAEALTRLTEAPSSPAVELDSGWRQRIAGEKPRPALRLSLDSGEAFLPAQLLFLYGGLEILPDDPREMLSEAGSSRLLRRDRQAERELAARLPFEVSPAGAGILPAIHFAGLVEELANEGWLIGAGDRKLRSGGRFSASVQSGVDWFDLAGSLAFGEGAAREEVPLPSLLQAVREGRGWINLEDGSVGLLPAGWVRRWSALIEVSQAKQDFRFGRGQALLLDSLLKDEADVQIDDVFGRIRAKLRSFDRLEPVLEPPGFLGELRPYQRLGLAWLELLADLGLGGCLADDMGLGKTVQVLAWLLRRKQAGLTGGKPQLLVVPRTLVFNWAAELRRFTPQIAFAVSHGAGRESVLEDLRGQDLLITTYGTLVRDVDKLRTLEFDTVVLDEAQAIKNRNTQAAEACSAMRSKLRLALTGTPVENHLGELWAIFEFLNPGLLGSLPRISKYAGRLRLPTAALAEVAAALRPLILRRKKNEVLSELPAKTEQTLICELGPEERRRYDELRTYYQASLSKKISEVGLERSKIWVLEALLRLRQAACHPGLIDKKAEPQSSAKLDALLAILEPVLAEGHKAIVFSQFTSLLALLRRQLDARGHAYEYLDGKTRDRQARVERFQTDPALRLFLISLKAGGVGLNLTAASYVFLLDPWWNPAVEAQAIDRAHRIGQQQPVFAYRIVAEGTVEEKILKLQDEKRALADAIVAEDARVLKQLTAADLEQLLG